MESNRQRLLKKIFTKLYLVSVPKDKEPSIRVKMRQTFFLFILLFTLYLLSGCDLYNLSSLS